MMKPADLDLHCSEDKKVMHTLHLIFILLFCQENIVFLRLLWYELYQRSKHNVP